MRVVLRIRQAWLHSLGREGHVRDAAQEEIVAMLEQIERQLLAADRRSSGLLARFRRKHSQAVRGLYIWGSVGRGKTFLMDLFFETLAIDAKKRIHFHRMMQDIHARLAVLGDVEDPLDRVAADIASETRVLCFDEFFVSDIGDAMILARLLNGLFEHDVTLITTSNTPPSELYRDGLQRNRFLPTIDLLNKHTQVINMDGDTDYRLRLLQQAGTYLTPDDQIAHDRLTRLFDESASSQIADDRLLEINGRDIRARRCARGIVWFDFDDICDGPRSQDDYIEIARWYPEVIISGVPKFDATLENQARRFIALVDEFYDRRVKLILSVACDVNMLYAGQRLDFEFDRTISRLIEMQSTDYLVQPHLC
jgi:cell division protein ZapE